MQKRFDFSTTETSLNLSRDCIAKKQFSRDWTNSSHGIIFQAQIGIQKIPNVISDETLVQPSQLSAKASREQPSTFEKEEPLDVYLSHSHIEFSSFSQSKDQGWTRIF
jgi:hypothetical protein